jgi:DNA polymerase III subunit gamma/tau
MAYQVLARKYRPQRFSDVKGQEHVTRTLLNALTQNRIAHGYIFSGHRGIGKTTIARILAMALNCRTEVGSGERPTVEPCLVCSSCREISSGGSAESGNEAMHSFDFIEIDAASNRGIDDVRSIRSQATVQPARDRYKIFLLDEAHQITDAAFNAILKTLEEPPEWAIFMMATTQPEDIPQTIRSRCQHFSFHAVRFDEILDQLRSIAAQENITAEDAALALLAEAGDGSMRDALSIMDQAIASAPVEDGLAHLNADQIRELMGTVPNAVFERLLEGISENQSAPVIEEIDRLLNAGNSPAQLARQFVRYLRNTLMARLGGENTELLQVSPDERARAARSAVLFSEEDLTRFLDVMLRTFDQLNHRQEQRFHLELGVLKLVHLQRLLPMEQFLSQLPAGSKTPGPGGGALPPARSNPSASRTAGSTSAPPRSSSASPSPGPAASKTPDLQRHAPESNPSSAPAFSPFEADRSRKFGNENLSSDVAEIRGQAAPVTVATAIKEEPVAAFSVTPSPTARILSPIEATAKAPVSAVVSAQAVAHGALALAEDPANAEPVDLPDLDAIREAVCAALEVEGHNTAAALLSAGNWSSTDGEVRVAVAIKKTMLSLTMNAEADKLCRSAMRAVGATQKLTVVPGENGAAASPKPAAAPRAAAPGSVQAQALAHPLVKQAQELFGAEVRSVLDLREKS